MSLLPAITWTKGGLIYAPTGDVEWMTSHAQMPVADEIGAGRLRIYFSSRDSRNRSRPTFVEVSADDPAQILYRHDRPVLGLGDLGTFDDSGVMPSWIVNDGGLKFLFYIGFNSSLSVPYRLSIGLAVSTDRGITFKRVCSGPVLDRTASEPHFCTAPCVLLQNGVWRMWHVHCFRWEMLRGRAEPFYDVRLTESVNGVEWKRSGVSAIELANGEGGIGRPCVVQDGDRYRMWFCYRGPTHYREPGPESYRLGYADSSDGIAWARRNENAGLTLSESGWDSEMTEYPYVCRHGKRAYIFYNGNGFGRSGLGFAAAGWPD
jgi:hypothetical protein